MSMKTTGMYLGTGLLGVIVGVAISGAGAGNEAAEAAPTVTATVTAEPEVSVPEACTEALDEAERIISGASDMAYLVSDHLKADQGLFEDLVMGEYGSVDTYTADLETFAVDIRDLTAGVQGSPYAALRAECGA